MKTQEKIDEFNKKSSYIRIHFYRVMAAENPTCGIDVLSKTMDVKQATEFYNLLSEGLGIVRIIQEKIDNGDYYA